LDDDDGERLELDCCRLRSQNMTEERVKWRCPGCQKVYGVKAGRVPKLCPDCARPEKKQTPTAGHLQSSLPQKPPAPSMVASLVVEDAPPLTASIVRRRTAPRSIIPVLLIASTFAVVCGIVVISKLAPIASVLGPFLEDSQVRQERRS